MNEQQIRMTVEELLSKYCRIVDCKDYDDFDKVFSSTARIEIVIQGLKFNSVQPFKDFLNETKPFSEDRMHTTSNLSLEKDGEDRLRGLCYWQSTMSFKGVPVMEGGWYEFGCNLRDTPIKFDCFRILHKYRVPARVESWKHVGFPGTEAKMSNDKVIFDDLKHWFSFDQSD